MGSGRIELPTRAWLRWPQKLSCIGAPMILPFIIAGLVAGAVYGLAAVGLVLTYRTSGVFNFAHGGLATISAYTFYSLHVELNWPWPYAAAVSVFGVGALVGLIFERLSKAVGGKNLASQVACTVGVLLVAEAVIVLTYGVEQTRIVPTFLMQGQFTVDGVVIQNSELITFLVACAAVGGLYLWFRLTRTGSAMRAVVDDPDLLELAGTNATSVRRLSWIVGSCFAAMSGVLFSSLLPLDPVQLTLLVVSAFGAASIAAFTSLPVSFAAGLALGVLADVATKYFTAGILAGIPSSMPFIFLIIVMLVFPKKYLVERSVVTPSARPSWVTPPAFQVIFGGAVVAFLLTVPFFAGIHLTDWTVGVANILLFLSLGLLVRTSGQVSLCHVSFLAIGACAFADFSFNLHLPWAVALVLACVVVIPVGAVLAIPAIRLSPLYLAIATFGFGLFLQYMFYQQSWMFGSDDVGLIEPRPTWLGLGSDQGFYYLVLAVVAVVACAVVVLERSRLGRILRAMADSPTAVATSGTATSVTWVLVFCLSAAIAAGSGALAAVAQQTVTSTSYPPLLSLSYLAVTVIVVGRAPWYAVAAALPLAVLPSYFTSYNTSYWLQLAFGAGAVLYAVTPEDRRGLPAAARQFVDRVFRAPQARQASQPAGDAYQRGSGSTAVKQSVLRVENLKVRFGGLVAVDDVSISVAPGRITGLIGPNGAGKSTLFNACSGLVAPAHGRIIFDDEEITRLPSHARARRGVGRTFQRMQLFESLSARENVSMGAEGVLAGSNPVRHMVSRRADQSQVAARTADALDLCGIRELADIQVSELSTGQRRLVELARCIAGPFSILLLDEPASGLDRTETQQFAAVLRQVVAERRSGVLLVEHDISLVADCVEYLYVLDFGRIIYEGQTEDALQSAAVQSAYLGVGTAEPDRREIRVSETP
jgi:ABC-type branched-subunit amino acid transport system ATPase component/branched-subunit amino acid ABC-type transport system permease component